MSRRARQNRRSPADDPTTPGSSSSGPNSPVDRTARSGGDVPGRSAGASPRTERTTPARRPRRGPVQRWTWREGVFLATTFLGSFLLFQIQPLIGKIILPWFGGTASVWTICLLFFQTILFAGYLYAHLTSTYLSPRAQVIGHAVIILAAALMLPIIPGANWRSSAVGAPTWGVLQVLAVSVGLPYFLLSTNAPLLQRWWSLVIRVSPYHLYSLSNVGSLLALLSYSLVAEPLFGTSLLAYLWSGLFLILAGLLVTCLTLVWKINAPENNISRATASDAPHASNVPRSSNSAQSAEATTSLAGDSDGDRGASAAGSANSNSSRVAAPSWGLRGIWLVLAGLGTGLLMSVTNFLCQDIASLPFMWLAPLTLYLLSFILCFGQISWYRRRIFLPLMMLGSYASAFTYGQYTESITIVTLLLINMGALFCMFMVVHGELERAKPDVAYLTMYYLYVSAGGMLGGFCVGLLAPLVFHEYYELTLIMTVVAMIPLIILFLSPDSWLRRGRTLWAWPIVIIAFGLAGMMWSEGYLRRYHAVLTMQRNFYGVLKVSVEPPSQTTNYSYLSLLNGHIEHGGQLAEVRPNGELELSLLPTTYYSEPSALGRALRATEKEPQRRVGAIGLGTGTVGAYAKAGDYFRFYEINPRVVELAEQVFSFLPNIKKVGADYEIALGDARLALESEPPQNFDVLVVDAFSGDSIPVHLLTREAAEIYLKHLKPHGFLAIHISNRYLDLRPILIDMARQNELDFAFYRNEPDMSKRQLVSVWVLLTRRGNPIEVPDVTFHRPEDLLIDPKVWTDERSSLLEVITW